MLEKVAETWQCISHMLRAVQKEGNVASGRGTEGIQVPDRGAAVVTTIQ